MTAQVNHAELKRLAEDTLLPMPEKRRRSWFNRQNRYRDAANPTVVLALLSEIEGLKAERDEAMTLDKGFYEWMVERDLLARGEEVDWSDIVVALTEHEIECCAEPVVPTQAPDSWRPDRDAERITTAAIRHSSGVIVTVERPDRHGECINFLNRCGLEYREGHGFLTSTGRFVDRQEAARIAEGNGQGNARPNCNGNLFSEDLWDEPLRPQTAESGK